MNRMLTLIQKHTGLIYIPLLYGLATLIALDNLELSDNEIKTRVKAYIETAKKPK